VRICASARFSLSFPQAVFMFNKSFKNHIFKHAALSRESFQNNRFNNTFDLPKFNKSSNGLAFRATGDSRSDPFRIDNRNSYRRSDRVGDDEGKDFYRFQLSRRREVEISVRNREFFLGPSLDFKLLNNSGSTIKSRRVRGDNTREIERTLSAGTYFIKVESGGESVPYRLSFKSESR
jgi:hypothetical protein